mgnify:CR=1 FL=1
MVMLTAETGFAGDAEDAAARAGSRFGEGNIHAGTPLRLALNGVKNSPEPGLPTGSTGPSLNFTSRPSSTQNANYSNPGGLLTGGGGNPHAATEAGLILGQAIGVIMGVVAGAAMFQSILAAIIFGLAGWMLGALVGALIGYGVDHVSDPGHYI